MFHSVQLIIGGSNPSQPRTLPLAPIYHKYWVGKRNRGRVAGLLPAHIRVNHWALVILGPSGAIAVQLGPPSCGCTAVEMCVGKPFLSNTSWGRSRRATSNGLPSVNVPLHHPVLCNGADVSHDTPSELRPILYEQPQCQISRNAPCSPGSRYKYGSLQTVFTFLQCTRAK